jgi:transcriptional regulator with XRE-family HTH domain
MKTTFGTFVREKRLEKKIGLREFAIMMDLSPAYISQMEADICNPPINDKIQRIAKKLEINADYLLALAGKISTENKQKIIDEILEQHQ